MNGWLRVLVWVSQWGWLGIPLKVSEKSETGLGRPDVGPAGWGSYLS